MPSNPPPDLSLPVLVWAEGGCDNNGTHFPNFLSNIASYGFIVLANGPPENGGDSDVEGPQYLRDSILLPKLAKLLVAYPDIKVEITIDYGLTDIVAQRYDAEPVSL